MKGSRVGSCKGSGGRGGAPQPTDLLVCFPTRSHLTLMPKPICSPSRRPTAQSTLFTTPTNRTRSQLGSEPTSPKVTCAGQIRVRSSSSSSSKNRTVPKHSWIEALGVKKDVMSFLRILRFNMQCFGSFRGAVDCCSDEDDDEEEEEEASRSQARTVLPKWFMVLEENNGDGDNADAEREKAYVEEEQEEEEAAQLPPKNALLLMRCRSAPTKGVEVEAEAKEEEGGGDEERLMLMSYAPDFFKMSTDVAKETWVVGSVGPLARCRSWRR